MRCYTHRISYERGSTANLLHREWNSCGTVWNPKSVQAQPEASFSKTDLRYWKERIFKPTYTRGGNRYEGPNSAVYIQHRRRRHRWSLGKPNRAATAAIAKDIFLSLQAKGWDATIQRYRPKLAEKKRNVTVGEFIEEVKAKADLDAKTIEGYCKAFRTIVASAFEIDGGKEKFDHRKGGHEKWLTKVHGIRLASVTPSKVQEWKRTHLARAKRDPLSQRQAKVSVQFFYAPGTEPVCGRYLAPPCDRASRASAICRGRL